jgi:hypothetical protein
MKITGIAVACLLLAGCAVAPARAAGSAAPASSMTCPSSHPVKGNKSSNSLIYHVPSGHFYGRTAPEDCFATEADATKAGYRKSQR